MGKYEKIFTQYKIPLKKLSIIFQNSVYIPFGHFGNFTTVEVLTLSGATTSGKNMIEVRKTDLGAFYGLSR